MFFGYTKHFSASYRVSRLKFCDAARAAGAQLASYPYPGGRGLEGEALAIDVARLGNTKSSRQFVMICATHGMEGFAGAALQTAWLCERLDEQLLEKIGVVLIHGLNPYGFSHGMRTTEAGIDLNRNFVDFSQGLPDNRAYDEVHHFLVADAADGDAWAQAEAGLQSALKRIGGDALFDAVARGQYAHPDGLFYGGTARTWENLMLEAIVTRFVGHSERVAAIDWHTGIGEYGKPFYLPFADEGSNALSATMNWWEAHNASVGRPHGRKRPDYRGLVFDGLRSFLPQAHLAGGVIEWGTRGNDAGDLAIRQDLWLRHHGQHLADDTRAQIRADLLDSLNPVSYQWRSSVLSTGLDIIDATSRGLADW